MLLLISLKEAIMSFQTNYIHLADEILSGKTSISYEQALEILNSDEWN